jgi:hypothetical protein
MLACRVEGCRASVWSAVSSEKLCIDHFIEYATRQLLTALDQCRAGHRITRTTLTQLVESATCAATFLSKDDRLDCSSRRDQMLELVLGVANLQEHLSTNVALLALRT